MVSRTAGISTKGAPGDTAVFNVKLPDEGGNTFADILSVDNNDTIVSI